MGGAAGRGGTGSRVWDGFRPSVRLEFGDEGDSSVVDETVRLRVNTTGDGEGVLEDDGDDDPEVF